MKTQKSTTDGNLENYNSSHLKDKYNGRVCQRGENEARETQGRVTPWKPRQKWILNRRESYWSQILLSSTKNKHQCLVRNKEFYGQLRNTEILTEKDVLIYGMFMACYNLWNNEYDLGKQSQ